MYSMLEKASDDSEQSLVGPEVLATTPSPPNEKSNPHKRHDSIAKSIVGSIRGLGRKGASSSPIPATLDIDTPGISQARKIPLPSSPVNIPAPAPALELDLGPTGFSVSPPSFFPIESNESQHVARSEHPLPKPYNDTSFGLILEDAGLRNRRNVTFMAGKPVRPRDILKLDFDELSSNPPPALPSPMPGTTLPLELDGAASDLSNLFERSVTPPTARDRKWLRSMRSLDAMAEACASTPPDDEYLPSSVQSWSAKVGVAATVSTKADSPPVANRESTPAELPVWTQLFSTPSWHAMADAAAVAHRNDELNDGFARPNLGDGKPAFGSPDTTALATASAGPPRRNALSGETLHSIPSDMQELTRQWANEMPLTTGRYWSGEVEKPVFEDPFADTQAVISGPPSPTRSVTLPLRLKQSPATSHMARCRKLEDGSAAIEGPSPANTYVFTPDAPTSPTNRVVFSQDAPTSPLSPAASLTMQMELQRNYDLAERLAGEEDIVRRREPSAMTDPFENPASDDDTCNRAQELYDSGIFLPNYDNIDSMSYEEGMSPQRGPLAHTATAVIYTSYNPEYNTDSSRARTARAAGLGDARYRFTVDNWLENPQTAGDPDLNPITPSRRHMHSSIDSVTESEERKTPQITPSTTTTDHTPSMGNRLDFDLKRSQRNMRYNALHQYASAVLPDGHLLSPASTPFARPPHHNRFIVGCSEDNTEDQDFQLADFDTAYDGAPSASPYGGVEAMQARIGSEESVAESLKNAAHDYGQLAEHLDGQDDVFADPLDSPFHSLEQENDWAKKDYERYTRGCALLEQAGKQFEALCALPSTASKEDEATHQSTAPTSEHTEPDEPTTRSFWPTPNRFAILGSPATSSPETVTPASGARDRVISLDTLDSCLDSYPQPIKDSASQTGESAGEEVEVGEFCVPMFWARGRHGDVDGEKNVD